MNASATTGTSEELMRMVGESKYVWVEFAGKWRLRVL